MRAAAEGAEPVRRRPYPGAGERSWGLARCGLSVPPTPQPRLPVPIPVPVPIPIPVPVPVAARRCRSAGASRAAAAPPGRRGRCPAARRAGGRGRAAQDGGRVPVAAAVAGIGSSCQLCKQNYAKAMFSSNQ